MDFGTRLNQQAQGSALRIRNTLKVYREACQLVIRMYDQSWNANTAEFDLALFKDVWVLSTEVMSKLLETRNFETIKS